MSIQIEQSTLDDLKLDADTMASIMSSAASQITTKDGTKLKPIKRIIEEGGDELLNVTSAATLVALTAISKSDGSIACVTSDGTIANNGFYERVASAWVKIGLKAIHISDVNKDLSDLLTVSGVNILNSIDPFQRIGVVPTVDFNPEPDQNIDSAFTFSRASVGTRVNSMGILEQIPANEVRHNYDPVTGKYRGVLLEEASTNYSLYSEDFDNAYWSKLNFTVTTGIVAPDGSTDGNRLTEDTTATGQRRLRRSSTVVSSGSIFTHSVFVKPSSNRKGISFGFDDNAGGSAFYDFNMTTLTAAFSGSAGTAISSTAKIETYPNGWYRLSVFGVVAASVTSLDQFLFFSSTDSNGNTSYTGDGSSYIDVWGMQIESHSVPTSYITTTTATVTRSEDILELQTSAYDWFVDGDGTLYIEFSSELSSWNTQSIVSLYNDTNNFVSLALKNSSSSNVIATVKALGINEYSKTLGGSVNYADELVKMAMSFGKGKQNSAITGVLGVEGSSVNIPNASTKLIIGDRPGTSRCLSGHIKRVCYTPFTLSQDQLKQITG